MSDFMSDIFESFFGEGRGRGPRGANSRERGADLRYNLEIGLEEAHAGQNETIRVPTSVTCEVCSGTGAKAGSKSRQCPTCGGHGRVRASQGFFSVERTCPTCNGRGEIIDVPGLGPRRVAPVETVDAEMLGPGLDVRSRVSFAAGLEAGIEQWGLALLAWLRRRGWVAGLAPIVPLLVKARRITRLWTSDRGGMRVAISGIDAKGRPRRAYWSLLAENDDGPQVPTLAAAAAVRALLADGITPGARSAAEALDLAAIEAEMTPYAIGT
eukprot:gene11667-14880_t